MQAFRAVLADESGATLVEYAILASAFSVLMITALLGIQNRTGTQFTGSTTGLNAFQISPP